MRLILFFVHLCFLLMSGSTAFIAGAETRDNCVSELFGSGSYTAQVATFSDKLFFLMSEVIPDMEMADIIDDDLEDDDDAISFAREYTYTEDESSQLTHPSYTTLLNHGSNCFRDVVYPIAQGPEKYILQGVLRI